MALPPEEQGQDDSEDWMGTYADAITLLMAFFVMLLSFTKYDIPAFEELSSALAANVGNRAQQTTTQSLKIDVQDIVYSMQADQVVTVGGDSKGVTIELQSNAFYKPGSAEIVPAAIPVLKKIAETLASPRYELYNVEIEGHTDDDPINSKMFPSNWELSTARSAAVVRLFGDNNLVLNRMKAAGFAETRPKVPNRDLNSKPIPENQATNRRVILRLSQMSLDERDAYLRAQEFREQQKRAKEAAEKAANPEQAQPAGAQPAQPVPAVQQ